MLRVQSDIDAADLVFTRLEHQPADGLAVSRDDLIHGPSVLVCMKTLLRFVLHVEEFAHALFFPTKPPQIVAATALVKREEERRVFRGHRAKTDRVRWSGFCHRPKF